MADPNNSTYNQGDNSFMQRDASMGAGSTFPFRGK